MKPGDFCRIVNPVWREWSDSDICMILRPVTNDDGIDDDDYDIRAECDWWVLWDDRETAWANEDLEVIE